MIKQIILLSVLLLFSTKSSFAQLYTWKDEQGITHITDDLTNAPPEIQKKYAIPIEVIELPKPIEKPKPATTSRKLPPVGFFEEGWNQNGKYFITNSFEDVKKKPYQYKFKWTTLDGIIFYSNRIFEDNESCATMLPKHWLPNGKFTQIIYK